MSLPHRSTVDPNSPPFMPIFVAGGSHTESEKLRKIVGKLNMQEHTEGGYYVETDRDSRMVPNPFKHRSSDDPTSNVSPDSRNACTSIHYLLTPRLPLGAFHRNKARTVHTLHSGRGRYIVIHADEVGSSSNPGGYGASEEVPESERWTGKARVESFTVGRDVLNGERLQWIVDGGKYKCSYLLPDDDGGSSSEGLLISETVVPGFEYSDHDFMKESRLKTLVTEEQAQEMAWMLRKAV